MGVNDSLLNNPFIPNMTEMASCVSDMISLLQPHTIPSNAYPQPLFEKYFRGIKKAIYNEKR
jgi:hypothetical protein